MPARRFNSANAPGVLDVVLRATIPRRPEPGQRRGPPLMQQGILACVEVRFANLLLLRLSIGIS